MCITADRTNDNAPLALVHHILHTGTKNAGRGLGGIRTHKQLRNEIFSLFIAAASPAHAVHDSPFDDVKGKPARSDDLPGQLLCLPDLHRKNGIRKLSDKAILIQSGFLPFHRNRLLHIRSSVP